MHTTPHSEETKRKISLAKKGKESNRKGAVLSVETREKISKNKRGKSVHSPEQKAKWGAERKGHGNPAWKHGLARVNSHYRKIRAERVKNAPGFHSQGEWEMLKAQYGFICLACRKPEPEITLTKDHVIPLVKGGSHFIENIQPLCQSCNSKKHTESTDYKR